MTDRAALVDEPRIKTALAQLLEAHNYAQDTSRSVWTFAIDLGAFRTAGLSANDLRWLVCGGYVSYAMETTEPADSERTFRPVSNLRFCEETCFVLTEAGVSQAKALLREGASTNGVRYFDAPHTTPGAPEGGKPAPPVPLWDPLRRELTVAGKVVKRFRLRSPNQETVLSAFQEESWPVLIDDPLPQQGNQDPKRRLQDTLKGLNRHQVHSLIRFKGDGTGEGVLWEWTNGHFTNGSE